MAGSMFSERILHEYTDKSAKSGRFRLKKSFKTDQKTWHENELHYVETRKIIHFKPLVG